MPKSKYAGHTVFTATTGSIQSYVFATNRLKDNAGASEVARQAMAFWAETPPAGWRKIFVGGGNAALLAPPGADWRSVIYDWSRRWLLNAPGLRLVTATETVGEDETLGTAIRRCQRTLRNREGMAAFGSWPGALPVVRTCTSSGAPASYLLKNEENGADTISNVVRAKRCASEEANSRLHQHYSLPDGWRFPVEFKHLGFVEGASQIAIVHIDGNGIGKLFIDLLGDATLDDERLLQSYSGLSVAVSTLAAETFRALVSYLIKIMPELIEKKVVAEAKDVSYLPLRPLVEAGDDLTFVCHGRLGLHLAAKYLELFERNATDRLKPFGARRWTACAGVMIQPQKFPFARGYRHADDLTANAKRARNEHLKIYPQDDASWIDFQAVYEGAQNSLHETRLLLYGSEAPGREGRGALLARPYALSSSSGSASWNNFAKVWRTATMPGIPRSRAKELLTAARLGENAPRELEPLWKLAGNELAPLRELLSKSRKEYWDALEMLDLYWEPRP